MPLDTNDAFKEKLRGRNKKPIFLYTIYDYIGDGTDKCFAAYSRDVVFDGVTYSKFPITHDQITENTKGEIDSVKVQVSNVSRLIEYYLQNYDLRGKRVSIKMVDVDMLDDPDAYIEFSNYIDSYTSNVKDVVFTLMSKFDILNLMLPSILWLRDYCQFEFACPAVRALGRGAECGYLGAETTCNRTWQRCQELGNSRRFLGARGIPGRRGYV
jgi:lambda family phage minor tail protein L